MLDMTGKPPRKTEKGQLSLVFIDKILMIRSELNNQNLFNLFKTNLKVFFKNLEEA